MNSELEEICNRIISALFDGGLRGALIVAGVWTCLKALRRANAATRHAAWFATLLIVAALPIIFFAVSKKPAIVEPVAAPAPELPDEAELFMPAAFVLEDPVFHTFPSVEPDTDLAPIPPSSSIRWTTSWQIAAPRFATAILVAVWIVFAAIRIALLVRQLWALGKIKRNALSAPAGLKEVCGEVCRQTGLTRRARLLISSEAPVPMVIGFFNPCVVIPQKLAAEPQLEPVLRHELAHVGRHDDWANLAQQFIKAIYFFHPGVLLASRRLTAEREIACDDHALAALPAPRDYALFLTEFASRMRGRDYAAAPAAWSSKSQLKERIVMILDGKRNASPRLDRTRFGAMTAASVLLALLAIGAGPRLAFTANAAENSNENKVKTAVSENVDVAIDEKVDVNVDLPPPQVLVTGPAIAPIAPNVKVTIPAVASVPMPPRGPMPAALPSPDAAPRPRIASAGRRNDEDNLERRLERLEKMVESLMGREKGKGEFGFMGPHGKDLFNSDEMKRLHKDIAEQTKNAMKQADKAKKQAFGSEDMERIKERAKRDAEHARRDAEHAVRDAERAVKDRERAMKENEWNQERAQLQAERAGKQRDQANQLSQDHRTLEKEREALEMQRRSIEKRIESIEKEMKKRAEKDSNRESGPKEKF
jgi:beta-lactamase regulating signal transducer with metallopeptidase domain